MTTTLELWQHSMQSHSLIQLQDCCQNTWYAFAWQNICISFGCSFLISYTFIFNIFECYKQQYVAAAWHAAPDADCANADSADADSGDADPADADSADADSARHIADAGQEVCTLLHVATFGSVIACLLRHFRASLASLPLLSQPVGNLPIGTWAPTSRQAQQEEGTMPEVCHAACRPVLCMVTAHFNDDGRTLMKPVYKCCVQSK